MFVPKLLEPAATCGARGVLLEKKLPCALFHHFAFRLKSVGVLDSYPQLRRVQDLLQEREYNRMGSARAQAPQSSASQRRIQRDEPVFADIEGYDITGMMVYQRGGHEYTVCKKQKRTRSLRWWLFRVWNLGSVIDLHMAKSTAYDACEFSLLLCIAADGLAHCKWSFPLCRKIDCAYEAIQAPRQKNDALLERMLGRFVRLWGDASPDKMDGPSVTAQIGQQFLKGSHLARPELGV
ncbi:protein of unknown function [Pararobbsia alpina]